jgi:hypothetical protein
MFNKNSVDWHITVKQRAGGVYRKETPRFRTNIRHFSRQQFCALLFLMELHVSSFSISKNMHIISHLPNIGQEIKTVPTYAYEHEEVLEERCFLYGCSQEKSSPDRPAHPVRFPRNVFLTGHEIEISHFEKCIIPTRICFCCIRDIPKKENGVCV